MNCIKCVKFHLLSLKNKVPKQALIVPISKRLCTVSEESNVNKKSAEDGKEKAEAAKKRLLSLLSEMTDYSKEDSSNNSALNLAKPKARTYIRQKKEKVAESDTQQISNAMMHAVKGVATAAGEDADKVEAELTAGIQAICQIEKETVDPDAELDEKVVEKELGEQMMSAVKAVASTVAGESVETIKSELTKKLLSMATESQDTDNKRIEKLFEGMKVETQTREPVSDRGQDKSAQDRRLSTDYLSKRSMQPAPDTQKVDIFDASPLNIFTVPEEERKTEKEPTFWNKLEEKELKSLVQFTPRSAFEEMIRWTEQGKFWKFPIDNQCDMEEKDVGFHEHVFLEQHLEGFPTKGPIRHFMELVCVGLSKNPYITAKRKKENIEWFRQYFKEKEHILREYNVLDVK